MRQPPARHVPVWIGLLLIAAIALFDGAFLVESVIGTVAIAPFLAARNGTRTQTLVVAVAAVLVTVFSALWNEEDFGVAYGVRLAVVGAAGVIAVIAARERISNELSVKRFFMLWRLGQIAGGVRNLDEVLSEIGELVVPTVADIWTCDLVSPEGLRRLGAAGDGAHPDAVGGPLPETTQHFVFDDDSPPDGEGARWRQDGASSVVVVPLRSRGEIIGVTCFSLRAGSRRSYDDGDIEFFRVFCARVALAIDNSGLDSGIREAERQLASALGQLDDAVIVTSQAGSVGYVNDSALQMLGVTDDMVVEALGVEELLDRLLYFVPETADPITPAQLLERSAAPAGVLVRARDRGLGPGLWLSVKTIDTDANDNGQTAQRLIVIEDMTTIKVEERIAFIKAEVAAATSVEEMCERVGHILVPTFVHGCLIALTEPTGDLSSVVINHEDDDRQRFLELAASDPQDELALRPAIEQGAEKSGVALIGGRTAFFHTAPLNFADQSVGAISLVDTLTGVPFEEKGAAVIADIGRKLAVAILNRRLTSRLLDTNHQLQRGLRPSVLPDVDGWEFAAEYLPAGKGSEVGGDFYDLFETPTGWVAVMGDVTGHGPIAARLTAVSRFGLRAVAELTGDLVEAVRQLNRMLIAEPELSLVTLTCVQFASPKPGGDVPVTVLRCGHPPPLLLTDGGVRSLGNIGPMLGALPDVDWTPEVVKVKHGETLVLYTDGVTDVKGRSGRFGEQRLLETLARNGGSAEETVAALVEELDRFRAGERTDDQAVMALCVEPCEPTFDADVVRVAEA